MKLSLRIPTVKCESRRRCAWDLEATHTHRSRGPPESNCYRVRPTYYWVPRSTWKYLIFNYLRNRHSTELWRRRRKLLTVINSLTVATRRNYGALSTLSGGSSTEGEGGRTGRRRTHRFSLSHSVTSDTSLHPCQSLARLMLAT